MSGDNQQSPASLQESVIVSVPENLDTDKMIPVECLPATEIYIPPPDYDADTPTASENISFHSNPSPGHSSAELSPHGPFSRNSVCEASRETGNGTSAGYNTTIYGLSNENLEESLKRKVNTDAGKNKSLNDTLPIVHFTSNSCQNNVENLDTDKMIPVECLSVTEIHIPPLDYDIDTPAASENISFHSNPSPGHSSAELSPHGSFSRNSVCEASIETRNGASAGYNNTNYGLSNKNHDESLKSKVNTDAGKNKSLNEALPLVHTFTKSAGKSSASFLPCNDECDLDDDCALLQSQDDSWGDEKYSLYDIQIDLEKKRYLEEVRIIQGRGINLGSKSMCVVKDRGNINGDTKLSSFQTHKKITSYVNRYSETEASNRMKNGERCELNPCKEMNHGSLRRWNTFRIPQRNPQLLHPIAQSAHKNFYQNPNLAPTFHRIPVPVQDNFSANKLYSSLISRFEKPPMPILIPKRDKIPSVHLSLKQTKPYRVTFLKDKWKVNMNTGNNSTTRHASDNESIYGSSIYENDDILSSQMVKDGAMIMISHLIGASCSEERLGNPIRTHDDDTVSYYSITDGCSLYNHRGSPEPQKSSMFGHDQIFNDQVENWEAVNTAYHLYQSSSPPEARPGLTVQTDDDKSVSYYSITDDCNLYGHTGSPIRQSFADREIPVPDSCGLTEQKCSKICVVNPEYEAQLYPPIQANGNKSIYDSNPQFSARYALNASTYFVDDPRNKNRDEQTKCCQFGPGKKETSFKSSNHEGISGQSENNSEVINISEPTYGSHGDSRMIQISMNIPTSSAPTIILRPSELPVAEVDGHDLTDRLSEIPSRDLASRWKCNASQVIVWLAMVLFFLSMLVYIINQDPTPVSPLVLVFLIPLILIVYFGFVKRCQMC